MDFAKPDADQPYFYKDEKHAEYVCSWCGLALELRHTKEWVPNENRQKPDNADHNTREGKGSFHDPIFAMHYIKKSEDIEAKLAKMNPEKDGS